MNNRIQELADRIQKETLESICRSNQRLGYESDAEHVMRTHGKASVITKIVPGNKYTKIDVGSSGKYMVDADGNIFGIKAYGVIHRGQRYGTLDTIDNYYWGGYRAVKK